MLLDDLLDVFLVNIVVPDFFRIDDDHRTLIATIHAAGLVDPDLATAFQFELADAILGIGLCLAGAHIVAAAFALATLVATEKNVMFVIAHADPGVVGID